MNRRIRRCSPLSKDSKQQLHDLLTHTDPELIQPYVGIFNASPHSHFHNCSDCTLSQRIPYRPVIPSRCQHTGVKEKYPENRHDNEDGNEQPNAPTHVKGNERDQPAQQNGESVIAEFAPTNRSRTDDGHAESEPCRNEKRDVSSDRQIDDDVRISHRQQRRDD